MPQINYLVTTALQSVVCPLPLGHNLESKEDGECLFLIRTANSAAPIALIRCESVDDALVNAGIIGALDTYEIPLSAVDPANVLHRQLCGTWYDLSRDHVFAMPLGDIQGAAIVYGEWHDPNAIRVPLDRCFNTDDGDNIYLLGHEFGYCAAVGANNLENAMDEAADHGLLDRFKVDPDSTADHYVYLGGYGDRFDLAYFQHLEVKRSA